MSNLDVRMRLTAQDQASRVFRNAQNQITQSTRAMSSARQTLGIRSEQAIQREINQTVAAYNRLKRSGTATSRELARAADATKAKIASLNAEMGKTSWGQRLGNLGRGVASATVGVMAGAAVATPKIKSAADYDLALAQISNTAYSGKSIAEKNKGKENIHQAIKESLTYGGTKEDAVEAMGSLMGEGNVSVDQALKLLPTIQKNATATGASTSDMTALVNGLLNFGVEVEDVQKALDYANAAGKAGGFELKDMARYAPELLSSAKNLGLSGLGDLKQVFSGAQQTYKVSGGAGQTNTNMVNFFSKLSSADTESKFKKLEVYNPKTKKYHGIDLQKSMRSEMEKGKNPLEAFMSIVDQVLATDKTYQEMLKKLESAKGDDKKRLATQIAKYVERTKLGEIMPDLQASSAMFAMRTDKNTERNVQEQYKLVDQGAGNQEDYAFMSEQSAVKFQILNNKTEMTEMENWSAANNELGKSADWFSAQMEEYPNLTKAIIGAKDALEIFGAALAGFSLTDLFLGKGKGLGKVGDFATDALGKGKGSGLKFGNIAKLGGVVGMSMMLSGDTAKDPVKEKELADQRLKEKTLLDKVQNGTATDEEKKEFNQMKSAVFVDDKLRSAFNDTSSLGSIFTSKEQELASLDYLKSRLEKGDVTDEERKGIQSRLDAYQSELKENAHLSEKYPHAYQQVLGFIRTKDPTTGASVSGGYSGLSTVAESGTSSFGQTLSSLQNLTNYQADFQQFGQTISDGLKAAVESQNFTIQNQIQVDLDGKIIAEQTSDYQYQDLKRG